MLAIELVRRVIDVFQALYRRSRTRHQLLNLDQRLLEDIGISHEQALREASKPFWRN